MILRQLQLLWVFVGSLLAAGAAGGAHWWCSTPIYEAQAIVRLPLAGTSATISLGENGELPEPVLQHAVDELARLDIPLGNPDDDSFQDLSANVRCRMTPVAEGEEAAIRFRTTEPDIAVPVLRTILDCWLSRLGRFPNDSRQGDSSAELARIDEAIARQRQHLETLEKAPREPGDETAHRQLSLQRAALSEVRVDLEEAGRMVEAIQGDECRDLPIESLTDRLSSPIVRSQAWTLARRLEQEEQLRAQRELEGRYEALYGRNHPRLKSAREKIAALVEELGEEDLPETTSPHARLAALVEAHRTYLQEQADELEASVSDLETRCQRAEERQSSLSAAQTELSRLEQDRARVHQSVQSLATPRAGAEITCPPTLLMKPVWPVASHHIAVSTCAGICLGALVCWRRRSVTR